MTCLAGYEHGDVRQSGHAAVRVPHADALYVAPSPRTAGRDDGPAHACWDALLPWLPASGLLPCNRVIQCLVYPLEY